MGKIRDYFLGTGQVPTGLSTPLPSASSTSIQQLVWSDFFQGELGDATRGGAMQVPAVARARSILVGIIAPLPVRVYDGDSDADGTPSADQPAWLSRTDTALPIWHRMAWTVDDLMFHGASLWEVAREGDAITDATRVPYERWEVDAKGRILIDKKAVDNRSVIYFPGPFEGLLAAGGPTIKGARAIERAWVGRAQNPIPLTELHQLTDDELTDEEISDMLAAWGAARTAPTGSVGFTDNRVELRTHGEGGDSSLFVEGRNATVLDVARLTGIPAALLDGSQSTASLTYSTQEGRRSEFMDFGLGYWTAPIEARLSMDDVSPPGTRVRFDRSGLIVTPNPATDSPTSD